ETVEPADVVVFVGLAVADVLARWRHGAVVDVAMTLLLLGLIAAASALLKRTADRREREQKRKEEQLALLSSASAEIVGLHDVPAIASHTAACARRIAGSERAIVLLAPGTAAPEAVEFSDTEDVFAEASAGGVTPKHAFEAPLLTADG